MKREWKERLGRLVGREIAIEYKACLYFCCIIFFYIAYLMLRRIYVAEILVIWEIVLTAYVVSYIQVYLLHNFDEAERIGLKELLGSGTGTGIYAAAAWCFGWFEKNGWALLLFVIYMMFVYFCVFLCNKIKRDIDTKNLNRLLAAYKGNDRHEEE